MSTAKGKTGLSSELERLREEVKANKAQFSSDQISNQASQITQDITNKFNTTAGQIEGQITGGIQSITNQVDGIASAINNPKQAIQGELTDAGTSLENLKNTAANAAISAIASKFGASVNIEFTLDDSTGILFPNPSTLDADGGISGTVSSLIQLITGLGAGPGSLQDAVNTATSEGLQQMTDQVVGKIGAYASVEGIKSLATDAITDIKSDLQNLSTTIDGVDTSFADINRTVKALSGQESDGNGNYTLTFSSVTSTANTVSQEVNAAIQKIDDGIADIDTIIGGTEVKKTGLVDDFKELSGVSDPSGVLESITNQVRNRENFSKLVDTEVSQIKTRLAKNSELGTIQSLSVQSLTNLEQDMKSFAPRLSDKDVQRALDLSQGNSADFNLAVELLGQGSNKTYLEIVSFLKDIDTTVTAATKPTSELEVLPEPYVIGSYSKKWNNGQDNPVFPYVNSIEELQAEVRNITREVTEVVVHWTETPTNKNIGSEEINEIHLASDLKGIGYHYVIRRDGSLQRGRPVNLDGQHADINSHNQRSIGIAFVGGINSPTVPSNLDDPETIAFQQNLDTYLSVQSLTRSQLNTFDLFCQAVFNVLPGIQIIGHNDIDEEEFDPGFDVRDYVLTNFGKESKFEDPLKQSPLTFDEITS